LKKKLNIQIPINEGDSLPNLDDNRVLNTNDFSPSKVKLRDQILSVRDNSTLKDNLKNINRSQGSSEEGSLNSKTILPDISSNKSPDERLHLSFLPGSPKSHSKMVTKTHR
jgi:hypothetical protein